MTFKSQTFYQRLYTTTNLGNFIFYWNLLFLVNSGGIDGSCSLQLGNFPVGGTTAMTSTISVAVAEALANPESGLPESPIVNVGPAVVSHLV